MIRALNHVSITTGDLDRSMAFYRDVLGLSRLGVGESDAPHLSVIIGFPEVRLRWAEFGLGNGQLLEYLVPEGTPLTQRTCDPGSVHIALETDELDAVYARLRAAHIVTRSPPVTVASGDWAGARCLYAVDPNGVTIELVQLPPRR
jgi:glyoxylase I family protein